MSRIILDTDIGTNPDDAVALVLCGNASEIQLEGVTTVYGDVKKRAKIAEEVIRLANFTDVKVYQGISQTLLRKREVFWIGTEGEGLDFKREEASTYPKEHAVPFMIKTIMDNPGEITLVTIGPLTNIATAIILEPRIIENVKEIIMMGGVLRFDTSDTRLSEIERNVSSDPEAASIVFASGIKILMVGLDVTRQIALSREELSVMTKGGAPINKMLWSMFEKHMAYLKADALYMSDPIAVSLLIDRSLVKAKRMKIDVDYQVNDVSGKTVGELSAEGNVDVAYEINKAGFVQLLKDRVFTR